MNEIGDLTVRHPLDQSTISHLLRVLADAGLVQQNAGAHISTIVSTKRSGTRFVGRWPHAG